MSILEKEVWVGVTSNYKHLESKGYLIPRRINKNGKMAIDKKIKIQVKIEDLPDGSNIKITKVCDCCGKKIPNQSYSKVIKQRQKGDRKDRCNDCAKKMNGRNRKENVKYENSLEYWAKENNKEYLLNEFSDKNEKKPHEIARATEDVYWWNCTDCGSEYDMSCRDRTSASQNCPYCRGLRVNHTNCLWATHPEIAKNLADPQIGYNITAGSNKKEEFKCPDCGDICPKTIYSVVQKGYSCSKCSDGLSYPEKFLTNLFSQLNVEFETQKIFEWSNKDSYFNKRYDFYLNRNGEVIIETHGRQHYDKNGFVSLGGKTLKEEQENDRLKEQLAKENGIRKYISLDCRISKLEYIKSSILNSKLNDMFDLSNVNWLECHEFACNSLVKTICELWNEDDYTTVTLSKKLKMDRSTLAKYLKQGAELNWCNYDVQDEIEKSNDRKKKQVVQFSNDGGIIQEYISLSEASNYAGISISTISNKCTDCTNDVNGCRWMFKEEYERNGFEKFNNDNFTIIQLSEDGSFIRGWSSMTKAGNTLNIDRNRISLVCKGKKDSYKGFKWMYKEDYDLVINN